MQKLGMVSGYVFDQDEKMCAGARIESVELPFLQSFDGVGLGVSSLWGKGR
jgi:hypothetical protein